MDAGTLTLLIADKKTGEILLQGFASGLKEGGAIVKDKVKIQQATSSIFKEFGNSPIDKVNE
ncbi:hypothetical protein AAE02nite_16130 [Adhaeribacter aerolatus]|uniref:DUF4136 domain-containing protein n=1 Tax=Adhaeribacter aerolatus TaxID=670289 RepID=A0A512AW45_9BACT|nr:DUF4136 domain-containing protein [Adhaeribacter aerolatus]GEO03949.1 hypothetical protein AAE02nite_16130 [Adhaeribacter aerolatus]